MNGEHVLVDGMLNGWLIPTGSHGFAAQYMPAVAIRVADWMSVGGLLLIVLLAGRTSIGRFAARQMARRTAAPHIVEGPGYVDWMLRRLQLSDAPEERNENLN